MIKNKKLLIVLTVIGLTINVSAIQNNEIENGVMAQKRVNSLNNKSYNERNIEQKHKNIRKKKIYRQVKRKEVLKNVKLRYLNKLNQIETCVLMADTKEDLKVCNQRVINLSKDLNKISNRINKSKKRNKFRKER